MSALTQPDYTYPNTSEQQPPFSLKKKLREIFGADHVSLKNLPWRDDVIESPTKSSELSKQTNDIQSLDNSKPFVEDFPIELTAEAIVAQLTDPTSPKYRQLVMEAEQMTFEGNLRSQLSDLLRQYIDNNRDSNNRDDLIAVASGIRKYVAMLDVSNIGTVASLLETGHRATVPLEIELEISKMIFRKFVANPPAAQSPEQELAQHLADIALTYLQPLIFPKGKFATVAMLSSQALVVMLSEHAEKVISEINKSPRWFRQQLRRRLDRVVIQWENSPSVEQLKQLTESIEVN